MSSLTHLPLFDYALCPVIHNSYVYRHIDCEIVTDRQAGSPATQYWHGIFYLGCLSFAAGHFDLQTLETQGGCQK